MALVPAVHKAVTWNTPVWGLEGQGWFLAMHCYPGWVQLGFLNGAHLSPLPPKASRDAQTRYLDIPEAGLGDERQRADWILQASRLPGQIL